MTFSFPAVIYKFLNRPTRYRYQDPFEEYKTRQEKKRAKQAAAQDTAIKKAAEQKKDDDLNWFGVKIGANRSGAGGGGGVGKYLNLGGGASLKRQQILFLQRARTLRMNQRRNARSGLATSMLGDV